MNWDWGIYASGFLGIAYHILTKYTVGYIRYGNYKPKDIRKMKVGIPLSIIAYTGLCFAIPTDFQYMTAVLLGATSSSTMANILKQFSKDIPRDNK